MFCTGYSLFILLSFNNDSRSLLISLNTLVYLVISFDIFFITKKFSNQTIIEPYQLITFPIQNTQLYKFYIILLGTELKNLTYLSVVIVFFIYNFITYSLLESVLSTIIWFLIFIGVQSWALTLYKSLNYYIEKYRVNLSYTGFILLFILQLVYYFDSEMMLSIPVISSVANTLYDLPRIELVVLVKIFIYLILNIVLSIIVFNIIPRFRYRKL